MATKIDVRVAQDFSELIDLEECKSLIRKMVADLAGERRALEASEAHPMQVDAATTKMFQLGPRHGLNTADMARARVTYLEDAQDRLWDWYRKLSGGEAS